MSLRRIFQDAFERSSIRCIFQGANYARFLCKNRCTLINAAIFSTKTHITAISDHWRAKEQHILQKYRILDEVEEAEHLQHQATEYIEPIAHSDKNFALPTTANCAPIDVAEIVQVLQMQKVANPVVIDIAAKASFADCFVIGNVSSMRALSAASAALSAHFNGRSVEWRVSSDLLQVKRATQPLISIEHKQPSDWVIVDFGRIVVHLFCGDARAHYNLEGLWAGDAQQDQEVDEAESETMPEKIEAVASDSRTSL